MEEAAKAAPTTDTATGLSWANERLSSGGFLWCAAVATTVLGLNRYRRSSRYSRIKRHRRRDRYGRSAGDSSV